jgi:ribosomal protein L7/L12
MTVESLKCPECGAPLVEPQLIVRCPYCNALLKVEIDEGMIEKSIEKPADPVQSTPAPAEFVISLADAQALAEELAALCRDGNKIEAIRRYRQRTFQGLTDSKAAVESLEIDPHAPFVVDALRVGQHAARQRSLHGEALAEAVRAMLAENDIIGAVKLYRQVTGVGVAEAKDAVEAISQNQIPDTKPELGGTRISSLEAGVRSLLMEGKKIDAIKLVREKTSAGLREAKLIVESIEAKLPPGAIENARQANLALKPLQWASCSGVLAAVFLLAAGVAGLILLVR